MEEAVSANSNNAGPPQKKQKLQQHDTSAWPRLPKEGSKSQSSSQAVSKSRPRPKPKKLKLVNVYSIGTTDLDLHYFNLKSLNKRMLELGLPHIDAFSLAFDYDRSGAARPIHVGEHIKTLSFVSKQRQFANNLQKIKARIEKCDSDIVNILCVCNQGRHRSVAESRLFREVLSRNNYDARGPVHLSRRTWYEHQCATCHSCIESCVGKEQIFNEAAQLF